MGQPISYHTTKVNSRRARVDVYGVSLTDRRYEHALIFMQDEVYIYKMDIPKPTALYQLASEIFKHLS